MTAHDWRPGRGYVLTPGGPIFGAEKPGVQFTLPDGRSLTIPSNYQH